MVLAENVPIGKSTNERCLNLLPLPPIFPLSALEQRSEYKYHVPWSPGNNDRSTGCNGKLTGAPDADGIIGLIC